MTVIRKTYQQNKSAFLWPILLFVLILSNSSCSMAGYFIGDSIDKSKPEPAKIFTKEEMQTLPANCKIQIKMKSGELQEGNFQYVLTDQVNGDDRTIIMWMPRKSEDSKLTPIDEIEYVVKPNNKSKNVGLGIGIAVDVASVVIAFVAVDSILDSLFGF